MDAFCIITSPLESTIGSPFASKAALVPTKLKAPETIKSVSL